MTASFKDRLGSSRSRERVDGHEVPCGGGGSTGQSFLENGRGVSPEEILLVPSRPEHVSDMTHLEGRMHNVASQLILNDENTRR